MSASSESMSEAIVRRDGRSRFRMGGRTLCEISAVSPAATAVIRFIESRFERSYGARPTLRVSQLLTLSREPDQLSAAVGIRDASAERLFLESYLPRPIEAYVPPADGSSREGIAEVAHLAGVEPGVSRYLFPLLTRWLLNQGHRWIAFTGTVQLRNSFERLQIPTVTLAPAHAEQLPDRGAGWGTYYDHQPWVMMANVHTGASALERLGLLQRVITVLDGGLAHEQIA